MLMTSEGNERTSSKKNVRRGVPQSVFVASLTLAVIVAFVAGTRRDGPYWLVSPVFGMKVAERGLDGSLRNENI